MKFTLLDLISSINDKFNYFFAQYLSFSCILQRLETIFPVQNNSIYRQFYRYFIFNFPAIFTQSLQRARRVTSKVGINIYIYFKS